MNIRRIVLATGLTLALCALDANAQTLTPRLMGQVSGKGESTRAEIKEVAEDPEKTTDGVSARGVALLSQADVSLDKDTTQIGLQAIDLFFNKDWRLYVRSTLPVPTESSEEDAGEAPNGGTASTLDDAAIAALFDPYGGALNLSTGGFWQLPFLKPHEDDVDHGLFVDARFGMKLLTLPGQSDEAPSVLTTKVTPFYAGTAILKLVRPVFNSADEKDVAGGFEFGVGYVLNVVADKSISTVLSDGVLERATHAARLDMALSLTSVAAITISWSPWSNTDFGKRFVVGVKLLNQNPVVNR